MPVYEYRCTQCEHQFELWQEVGGEAPPCPECHSAVKKIFHPVRTIFKGSGFYITDTRAEKSSAQSSAQGKPAGEGSTSPEPESKAAAKSESSVEGSSGSSSSDGKGSTPTASTPPSPANGAAKSDAKSA